MLSVCVKDTERAGGDGRFLGKADVLLSAMNHIGIKLCRCLSAFDRWLLLKVMLCLFLLPWPSNRSVTSTFNYSITCSRPRCQVIPPPCECNMLVCRAPSFSFPSKIVHSLKYFLQLLWHLFLPRHVPSF